MSIFFGEIRMLLFSMILVLHFSTYVPNNVQFYGFISLLLYFSYDIIKKSNNGSTLLKKNIAAYTYPYFFAVLYTFFLIIVNQSEPTYLMRGLSVTVKISSLALASYALLIKYKERTVDFLFLSFSIAYFTLTMEGVVHYGPEYIIRTALDISESRFESSVEGGEFDKMFEFHDFGLTMPLIALYYLVSNIKWYKKLLFLSISILVALICAKRIAIAALACCFVTYLICSIPQVRSIISKVGGFIIIMMALLFLSFIYSNQYVYYAMHYNIDMKGRDFFYQYFIRMSDFSFDYIGRGFDFVSRYIQEVNPFGGIMGVHNDILRLYIDLGFVGLLIFLFLMFEYNRSIHKKISNRAGFYFILCSLYCFITYFSDNTVSYGLLQMSNVVIPIVLSYEDLNKKSKKFVLI